MIRRATAVLLTLLLTLPSANVIAAGNGTIEGSVTVGDRPLRGATLAFIDLSSGAVHRAASDAAGHFSASVPAGQYAVTTESGAGLVVTEAPAAIVVGGGRTVVADVGLLAMPGAMMQDATAQDAAAQAACAAGHAVPRSAHGAGDRDHDPPRPHRVHDRRPVPAW